MTRGGKRDGAGRPAKPETRKVTVSLYVDQDVAAFLKGLGVGKNELVSELVREFSRRLEASNATKKAKNKKSE